MNAPIFRLFALFVVLFAVLVAFSRAGPCSARTGLRENPKNSRVVIEEQRIKRGVIRAANKRGAGRQHAAVGQALRAPLSDRARCSRSRSASTPSASAAPGSSATTTTP